MMTHPLLAQGPVEKIRVINKKTPTPSKPPPIRSTYSGIIFFFPLHIFHPFSPLSIFWMKKKNQNSLENLFIFDYWSQNLKIELIAEKIKKSEMWIIYLPSLPYRAPRYYYYKQGLQVPPPKKKSENLSSHSCFNNFW